MGTLSKLSYYYILQAAGLNLCDFSKSLLSARTLKEAGLYDNHLSIQTFKDALTIAGVDLSNYSGHDRKKLGQIMVSFVHAKCSCLKTIQKSKHFKLDH